MLAPPDRDLVRRDPSLPGLKLLLDADALAHRLGCRTAQIGYLRYKPTTSCLASVRTEDGRFWMIKAFTRDSFAEAKARPEWRCEPHRAEFWLDTAIAVLPPVLDRHLRGLRRLCSLERVRKYLNRLAPDRRLAAGAQLEWLRFKPERRLVARIVAKDGHRGLLKLHARSRLDRALAGARMASSREGPALLATDHENGCLITEWVDGRSLAPGRSSPAAWQAAGEALARYHGLPAHMEHRETKEDARHNLAVLTEDATALLPSQADRLERLRWQLCQRIDELSTTHGLIHGDFSADQVIVDEQSATIIDWDRAAMGDQGADLGSLLAGLDRQALTGRITFAEAALCRENFLAGYRRFRPVPPSVQAQTLVHLARLLTEPFRQRAADWDRQTVRLIDRLEAELDAAGPNGGSRYTDLLARTLDRDHMSPRIAAWTGTPLVATPELVRLKPGRRALISYEVVDANGAEHRYLGKLHFSRPDRKTPARHARLRRAGLDERSDTAVPRAIVPDDLMPIWLMEHVPGRRLADFMSPEGRLAPFRQTGRALARLHGSGVWTEAAWSYADELAVLSKALATAGEGCPALAPRLAELRADASVLATVLAPVPDVLLHRDFYFDQLLIDGERVWLLDLDCAALGDPAVDLGNFLAHLIEYGMRRFGDARALQRHMDSFIDGYSTVREPDDSDRIEILTLISLCRHVNICMSFPDRAHLQGALLEFCRDMANRLKQCLVT